MKINITPKPLTTFLLLACYSWCVAQFPMVVYNSASTNINVRATPSTSGTFLCTVAPGKRLVAISQSGSWYEVYIPINGTGSPTTAYVSAGSGYMLPDNAAAQVQVTGTNVLVRKTAGGTGNYNTLWAYYPGYDYEYASTVINQRYYPTGNTQSVGGYTWYELDMPRSCYQCNTGSCTVASDFSITTLGWISGQYLTYISPCSYSLSPTSVNIPAQAYNGSVGITAASGCAWSASSSCNWVSINNNSGSGSGTINYTVDANTSTSARTCTITVQGQTYTITQAGATPCTYSISPTTQNYTSAAGTGQFMLTTGTGCSWSANSSCNWVQVVNSTGTGSGVINFNYDQNTFSNSRTCFITVAGQTFTITQDGVGSSCTYTLSPTAVTHSASSGTNSFAVSVAPSFCTWTATENCSWITLTNSFGTGNGTVTYNFDSNALSTVRSCDITVNGQTFTVTQNGTTNTGCNQPTPVISHNNCTLAVPFYANANYEWQWNGQTQQSGTSRFFNINSITGTGYYTCIVTIGNCTYPSNDLFVNYNSQQSTPCSVVGLSQIESNAIHLSPNPSNGSFNLSLQTSGAQTIHITVLDLQGKTIYHQQVHTTGNKLEHPIHLSKTNPGTYILQIATQDQYITKTISIF